MKKNLGKIINCVSILLALVAILMMFAPAISYKTDKIDGITGVQVAFGKKDALSASAYMLSYLLTIVGIALAVLALLGKGGKIVPLAAAVCFIAAAICFFLPMVMVTNYVGKLEGAAKDKAIESYREILKQTAQIGAGAIVGGILSILAGAAVAVPVFLKK